LKKAVETSTRFVPLLFGSIRSSIAEWRSAFKPTCLPVWLFNILRGTPVFSVILPEEIVSQWMFSWCLHTSPSFFWFWWSR
jgi:hypothetical protein